MRAKSVALVRKLQGTASDGKRQGQGARLPYAERRAQILQHAVAFFAEYGLTAQTRALAHACGVSQRLLYRFFPTKAALLEEVYRTAIVGPYKAVWFTLLTDRSKSVEQRLNEFYRDYFATILTRRWLRLFLYASLAEVGMAPNYIAAIIMRLLETIVEETAREQGVRVPSDDKPLVHELGWTLHGAVSHMAIRKHLYQASQSVPEETIIRLHVRAFLAGFAAMVAAAEERPAA